MMKPCTKFILIALSTLATTLSANSQPLELYGIIYETASVGHFIRYDVSTCELDTIKENTAISLLDFNYFNAATADEDYIYWPSSGLAAINMNTGIAQSLPYHGLYQYSHPLELEYDPMDHALYNLTAGDSGCYLAKVDIGTGDEFLVASLSDYYLDDLCVTDPVDRATFDYINRQFYISYTDLDALAWLLKVDVQTGQIDTLVYWDGQALINPVPVCKLFFDPFEEKLVGLGIDTNQSYVLIEIDIQNGHQISVIGSGATFDGWAAYDPFTRSYSKYGSQTINTFDANTGLINTSCFIDLDGGYEPMFFRTTKPLGFRSDVKRDETVLIYPNPVQSDLGVISRIEISSVEFYDLSGRLILIRFTQGAEMKLDVSELSAGAYATIVRSADGVLCRQLLLKH